MVNTLKCYKFTESLKQIPEWFVNVSVCVCVGGATETRAFVLSLSHTLSVCRFGYVCKCVTWQKLFLSFWTISGKVLPSKMGPKWCTIITVSRN